MRPEENLTNPPERTAKRQRQGRRPAFDAPGLSRPFFESRLQPRSRQIGDARRTQILTAGVPPRFQAGFQGWKKWRQRSPPVRALRNAAEFRPALRPKHSRGQGASEIARRRSDACQKGGRREDRSRGNRPPTRLPEAPPMRRRESLKSAALRYFRPVLNVFDVAP